MCLVSWVALGIPRLWRVQVGQRVWQLRRGSSQDATPRPSVFCSETSVLFSPLFSPKVPWIGAGYRSVWLTDLPRKKTQTHHEPGMAICGEQTNAANVPRAAMYIQDALDGVQRSHPSEGRTARVAHLAHLAMARPKMLALCVLVGLSFFETPTWTYGLDHPDGLDHLNASWYPMSGLPLLSFWWSLGLEIACLVPLLVELGLRLVAVLPPPSPGPFSACFRSSSSAARPKAVSYSGPAWSAPGPLR